MANIGAILGAGVSAAVLATETITAFGARIEQPISDPFTEFDGPITIHDLEYTGGPLGIVLRDSLAPTNLRTSGELRSVVTRYPGNSKASMQIMGTKEEPIELEGRLRDVWIGSRGGAQMYATTLRGIFLGQHYCELLWGGVTRRGYLRRVELEYTRAADIHYKISFEVIEADEAEYVAVLPFPVPAQLDVAKALRQAWWKLNALDVAISAIGTAHIVASLVPSTEPVEAVILLPPSGGL